MNIEINTEHRKIHAIKVFTNDVDVLKDEIATISNSDAQAVEYTPVLLNIKSDNFGASDLAILIEIITQNSMVVIGICSTKQELIDFANFANLVVFTEQPELKLQNFNKQDKHSRGSNFSSAPKIYSEDVDSLTQLYCGDGDIVVLGKVNNSAEIIASGNVLAYKEVSGKVLAGVDGDEKATIFIQSFSAQLISIAGVYKIFDFIPAKLASRSVFISLLDGNLQFKIV